MKHLLSSSELTQAEILDFLERAQAFLPVAVEKRGLNLAEGKILATLFYEPSTRTRFSFETAMLRLGGRVISNADMSSTSSSKKGESLFDTGKTVSQMANVIAMRHPEKGSVAELARGSDVPVVNAGDGSGDHPTQGLLDLFTVYRNRGNLENFSIAMVGDLKNSRVFHSQVELLKHFKGIRFTLVAPRGLEMPEAYVKELEAKGFDVKQTEKFEEALSADVLSINRIQKERFASEAEYETFKGVYTLRTEHLVNAPAHQLILDPLPRVDEMDIAIDADPRAKYFEQVQNGVAMRMAILAQLLGL